MTAIKTEEQFDILGTDGKKTGKAFPKSIVHDQELPHGIVFIWIYNSKCEVLLQLRSKDKKTFPNVWDVSVAGHISAGETPLDAALREIEEEVGIRVGSEELLQVDFTSDVVPMQPNKTHPEFCWVYVLHRELNPQKLRIQESEIDAAKLLSIREIRKLRDERNSSKILASRNPRIYEKPFEEIERILGTLST
jgi:isopentenyl-diphosphate delta-isomerase